MGDTIADHFRQPGPSSQDSRLDSNALAMLIERGFLTIGDIDKVVVDLLARAVLDGGAAGQDHAVSVIVDHVCRRADDTNANDSFGEVGRPCRDKAVAEDESI